ncbi:hypothetical protein [Calidithermus roseus]|uniref:Uncharacterized protein n=1 Tax=Calidithermus roseus TaxID=1644118 RepID=A0A399EPV8_9DEIN|nr:hypothetical protein [Calidithermus roseus]RIH86657.1 hypothetical protein Mrose_01647 [Calidithermus roseus]
MKGVRGLWIGPNFTIFVFFLVVALLEAFKEHHWLTALFWLACGLMFVWVDLRSGGLKPR